MTLFTKKDFKQYLIKVYNEGTLLTSKHDPYNLGIIFPNYRTVVSYDVAAKLLEFIDIGIDRVFSYTNNRHPKSPAYFEIVPTHQFYIPSSGVTSYSPHATLALDRIVVVSGRVQGWHIFGESSLNIIQQLTNGDLTNKQELR